MARLHLAVGLTWRWLLAGVFAGALNGHAVAQVPASAAAPGSGNQKAATSGQAASGQILIKGVPYQKLATREETLDAIRNKLFPNLPVWGEWSIAFPFDYPALGHLKDEFGPDADLEKMHAGGPGPDLKGVYKGQGGAEVHWQSIGKIIDRKFDINALQPGGLREWTSCYLYTTVTAPAATTVEVETGSDDGMRFWLNGQLLVDVDVPRGLDPTDHRLKLNLKQGVNHILAKIGQGRVNYEFQLNTTNPLDPPTQAMLDYHLEMDFPSTPESEYYPLYSVLLPSDAVLEVGGLDCLPDGRPIVSTRRGDIYVIDNGYEEPPFSPKLTKFATGLHEPLGLSVRREKVDGKDEIAVYCVQRGELTRLVDRDGDGAADEYRTFCDSWGVSGNYHEFAFGPKFDRDGNAWVTLNVGFCGSLGKAVVPYRGWAVKVSPAGVLEPICGGLRSPNGIGMFTDGQMFYLDNQGDYVGTNRMSPLVKGAFMGHPSGLRWDPNWKEGMPNPPVQPAAVWFPYPKTGQSAADFLLYAADHPGGQASFGPFAGQVFVGDQTLCLVNRVQLTKVIDAPSGVVMYQGAVFPFRKGLQCGVNRLAWGNDGSMWVGETDRGWGSIGRARYGVERIKWSGKTPFEIQTMDAASDGFDLVFTMDVDAATARDAASYTMQSYTYEYHAEYGSKEMERQNPKIVSATVTGPRSVHLKVEGLREGGMGYVHELKLPGVKSAASAERPGAGLLHPVAYYTLQKIPTARAGR